MLSAHNIALYIKRIMFACVVCISVLFVQNSFADCASGQVDVDGTCYTGKFALKTTNMTGTNQVFKFMISAKGTFTVDCGDSGTLSGTGASGNTITRSNTTAAQYTCTYPTGGVHTIRFGGAATEYTSTNTSAATNAAIGFSTKNYANNTPTKIASIYGSLGAIFGTIGNGNTLSTQPRFIRTFQGCTKLTGSIPANLFAGIFGAPAIYMFFTTFSGCSKLTGSIPENLFASISGAPAQYMFGQTFMDCTGLTGSIPENLFAGISGAPASYMFAATFYCCRNLTGSIPENLFAGIKGAPANDMFYITFGICENLTGSIPANLFAGIKGAPANDMFYQTFSGCSGLTSIPENLFAGIKGAPASNMFYDTFSNCSGLTGFTDGTNTVNYVPGNFLSGIDTDTSASYQATNMFGGTSLLSTCPSNTTATTRSQFSDANKPWCGTAYTITYNLNDGSWPNNIAVSTGYITEMTPKTLQSPVREDYTFGGWYDNAQFTGNAITSIPSGSTGNKTYYAKWSQNVSCDNGYSLQNNVCVGNTITIIWNGASAEAIAANNAGTMTYGGDIRTPQSAIHVAGKTFTGWQFVKL